MVGERKAGFHKGAERNLKNRRELEVKLKGELEKLKMNSGMGHELRVRWLPNPNLDRHGEVKGDVICIYDEHEERAILTLKHEFIDYHISKEIVKPLIKYINMQKCLIEDLIYSRKERLVKRILKLL
ncbi:hypothetical protein DRO69_02410 [Candidatus Bathyarchaeota archaeon]|nr:MAG: hypothetical protein DRO69_02410 [Candidatus Bathyarchaeota archaeon]